MNADDVLSDVEVSCLVALVQNHEKEVETTHDGRADLLHASKRANKTSAEEFGGGGGGDIL